MLDLRLLRIPVLTGALACAVVSCQSGGMRLDGTSWAAHHRGSIETIAFHNGIADIAWDMT